MAEITIIQPKTTPAGKLRCGAYCRVSTDSADQLHSFAAQRLWFAARLGGSATEELVDIYADVGISGTTADRPEFRRMLEDCRQGRLDRIITKSVSRFARNARDCLFYLRELKELAVTVYFEKENIDTARWADEMMIAVLGGLAQEESRSISENIRWSLRRRMAAGALGIARVPYGFVRDDDGRLAVSEGQAETVRRIFSLYLGGMGARRIAVLFNAEGVPAPRGGAWNNKTICKMLTQEKYIGDIRWQKTVSEFMGASRPNKGQADSFYVSACHKPIIDIQTFIAVQSLRAQNTRKPRNTNESPFRHKLICGLCGRSYYFIGANRPYWQCSGRFELTARCTNGIVHDEAVVHIADIACAMLFRHAEEIILPLIDMLERISRGTADTERLERLDQIRAQKMALRKMCAENLISFGDALAAETELNREYDAITETLRRSSECSEGLITELKALCRASFQPDCGAEIIKSVRIYLDTAELELPGGLHIRLGIPSQKRLISANQSPLRAIRSLALCGRCGGRMSRRIYDGKYFWRCGNSRCPDRKMRIPDETVLGQVTEVAGRVVSSPRLVKIDQEITEYRPSEGIIRMQNSLNELIEQGKTDKNILTGLALQLAEDKLSCIRYCGTRAQTERILSAISAYSGLTAFLGAAVKHIFITPERLRVKFINGKTVRSERSNENE